MKSIKDLKITTLVDNLVMTNCLGQWGLSFLLEFIDGHGDHRKVIFDTGVHKKSLLYNIKQLKVNLSDVDCLVISHGHGDHTAANVEVTKAAGSLKVYAHPHVFQLRFYEDKNGKRRKHGVPEDEGIFEIEQAGGEVLFNNKPTEILPGVWTTGEIPRVTQFEHLAPPSNGGRRVIVVDEEEIDDQILDDQALWMNVKEVGPIIITGCAHSGTVNTLLYVQKCVHEIKPLRNIYGFVGGTHLIGCSQEYLMQTIGGLKEFNLGFISPCHCTGFKAAAELWKAFSKAFVLNFSGRVIRTGKKLKKPIF